jgi:hypothetical protein
MVRNIESQLIALETTVASEMTITKAAFQSKIRAEAGLTPIRTNWKPWIDEDPSRIRSYSFITRGCNLSKPQGLISAF